MDLEELRSEADTFLCTHARRRTDQKSQEWGEGSDRVGLFKEQTPAEEIAELHAAVAWRASLFDAGLGWLSGPVEYGGRGLSHRFERAYAALESAYETPNQAMLGIGINMVAPTILAHGSDAAREHYLARIRRGDLVGCQLFSEPDAGSDLASVRTRAIREGDSWRISGAKVWTSHARHADFGIVLCRTDLSVPKHEGMTVLIVDMHAPGVSVRRLRQMTGGATFNSVDLDEVLVPDTDRLGEVGEGWAVARTTLMNERASIGDGGRRDQLSTSKLIGLLIDNEKSTDPLARQELASLYSRTKAVSMTSRRAAAGSKARSLGHEASVLKIARSLNLQRLSVMLGNVLGERLVGDTGEWGTFAWSELVLGVPGTRLGGGTDEIQKNIIAERVLGLPKAPAAERQRVQA